VYQKGENVMKMGIYHGLKKKVLK